MTSPPRRFLSYGRQQIGDDDIAAVTDVLRGDVLTTGPKVAAFELSLAKATGAAHAVVCSSGTAALHLAAMALNLGPGDKVVMPALTFLATANVVRLRGAEVVFADVNPETGLMGAQELSAALAREDSENVKAVFPVHYAGQCAAPDQLAAAAKGLPVVVDSCHALGTAYGVGGKVGDCRHAVMETFSFHPVKTVAAGEGGAVTTNDGDLAQRLRRLRNHGITRDAESFVRDDLARDGGGAPNPWYYEMTELGLNCRLSDLHCALGLSQLVKLDAFCAARRALAAHYDEKLVSLAPLVKPLGRVPDCDPAWHLYVARIDFAALGLERAAVMTRLTEAGIGTQVHYLPLHMQPYYRDRYGEISLPGAETFYRQALSLPLFQDMTEEEVEYVVETLGRIVAGAR
ncbi:MAG: UDP-4-amino-4,6-dideoxy-N-acetyl-beta-L-altrosamine transaminase [Nitrospinae bacterium]|jgi:UDP-4-amino-4,6-dideoxy-N-acetyl-beta-L-altrosamine transaminase|nr:UDP-4-amino-4,6-dideoxy-N-acetyl-beta-L-altrosamine transaminase [Nitrospinota bacterium]MDP6781609.1 UDP-4-amino-4,6-dideoxy-N-acetyl-beta-L-altrosamine transaminase [Alphaproteobacteria bacterium]|tara:strand:- start:1188 stop:2393 length:1206 start_codon:yes stop_codon:yes gene_type:complete